MGSAYRVLQAADFCLHQPLEPVGVLPADLREIFNQARERAALKVIQTALTTPVDLLLLTGQLAHFEEEPRLACFLFEQFRRLQSAGIPVVWGIGHDDDHLPEWAIDGNVSILSPGRSISLTPRETGKQITVAWPGNGQAVVISDSNHLVISLQRFAQGLGVEYSVHGEPVSARHRTISIQPESSLDQSICGMWLVESQPSGGLKPSLLTTATVQWTTETIEILPDMTRQELLREMERRLEELRSHQKSELELVQWKLTGQGALWPSMLKESEVRDLLQACRSLPVSQQRLWSWRIDATPSEAQLANWRRDSIPFAESMNVTAELTDADRAAASGAGILPGQDVLHPLRDSAPHFLQRRLARSLLRPDTDVLNDAR